MDVRCPPNTQGNVSECFTFGCFLNLNMGGGGAGWAPRLDNTCCVPHVEASFNLYAPHVEHLL
jgi:hypothetical protein